jgi:hypothetical protein
MTALSGSAFVVACARESSASASFAAIGPASKSLSATWRFGAVIA